MRSFLGAAFATRRVGSQARRLVGCGAARTLGSLGLLLALVGSCRVPRLVHEPREYPDIDLGSSRIDVEVDAAQLPSSSTRGRQLTLPQHFKAAARARLQSLVGGSGPALQVLVRVRSADEVELVDARGEMTRVLVQLELEVKVAEGPVLRTAHSQSSSDIPRDEASAEEVALVLDATALDALDRYFANPSSVARLNADLAAYQEQLSGTAPAVTP
jgi:hypothetical protein